MENGGSASYNWALLGSIRTRLAFSLQTWRRKTAQHQDIRIISHKSSCQHYSLPFIIRGHRNNEELCLETKQDSLLATRM